MQFEKTAKTQIDSDGAFVSRIIFLMRLVCLNVYSLHYIL